MNINEIWNNIQLYLRNIITEIDASQVVLKIISVLVILILMKIILSFGNRIINGVINPNKFHDISSKEKLPINFNIDEKRYKTLNAVSKSIFKYTVWIVGGLSILGNFMEIGSLLTVAGVGGIAIAFGAQNLVEDFVTGFFILFEDHFSVGEYITVGSCEGIVEEIGLRITKIRGFSGDLYILHNRSITEITNHARGNMRALIDVPVAYEQDIQKSIDVLRKICLEIRKENNKIVEGPEVLGVEKLDESSINIRIIAQTLPMEQWGIERIMRQRIKETFDKEGIEIPYNKMVIYKSTED